MIDLPLTTVHAKHQGILFACKLSVSLQCDMAAKNPYAFKNETIDAFKMRKMRIMEVT